MADGGALPRRIDAFVDRIDPDPSNPRRAPGQTGDLDVADILDSVRQEGVRDPLWVRTLPEGRYGLIRGERRWTAARLSGCEWVPCELHDELTPAERLALQISDGTSPLTPLAEAAGMARLRDEHRLEVEEIAARTGRSVRLVRQRLALLTLCDVGRSLLVEGRVSLALALDLATLAKDAQIEAAVALAQRAAPGAAEPLSHREAEHLVRSRRMRLADAGFPLADATLPGGSCLRCPKRSGAQAELWADVCADKDACTDPECFKRRRVAHSFRVIEAAKASRIPVLAAAAAKKLFPYRGAAVARGAGVVDLDAPCDLVRPPRGEAPKAKAGGPEKCAVDGNDDGLDGEHDWLEESNATREPGHPAAIAGCEEWATCECGAWEEIQDDDVLDGRPKGYRAPTWREALGQALAKSSPGTEPGTAVKLTPSKVAQDEGGNVHELLDERRAREVLVSAGMVDAKNEIRPLPPERPAGGLDKWQIESKADELAGSRALVAIGAAAAKRKADAGFWRFLAALCVRTVRTPAQLAVEAALCLKSKTRDEGRAQLLAAVGKADEGVARAVVVQLLAAEAGILGHADKDYNDGLTVACRFFQVDTKALQKAAEKEIKAAAKASPKVDQKKASGAGVGHSDEPACVVCGCTESHACEGGCAWADLEQTICTCCSEVLDVAVSMLEETGNTKGDDMLDAIGDQLGEEPWWKQSTAEKAIAHLVARGTVRKERGILSLAAVSAAVDSDPLAEQDGDVRKCAGCERPFAHRSGSAIVMGAERGKDRTRCVECNVNPCPLDWPAVARLAELVGFEARPGPIGAQATPWLAPAAVWKMVQTLRASVGATEERKSVGATEERKALLAKHAGSAGEACVDVALGYLLDSGLASRERKGKTGWIYTFTAAARTPTLPGLAGERRHDDPVAEMELTKLERKLLDVCKTARTVKQAKLACRDFRAADVDAAIMALGKRGELLEQGDKIVTARAPA
jgi:ParB/RepB/Spo0J family partition protein